MVKPAPLPPRDALHTADQAAQVLEVPAARIRAWKRAGQIAAAGMMRGPGRGGLIPMFYLDELADLARRYRAKHPARHTGIAQH